MYLLTWNPTRWAWDELSDDLDTLRERGSVAMTWSCGRTRRIQTGERVFLMRLGSEPKGIVGSGTVVVPPFESEHWDPIRSAEGETGLFVEAAFDHIAVQPVITFDELSQTPFVSMNWTPQASGTRMPAEIGDALEQLWSRRTGAGAGCGPDEMLGDVELLEGASKTVVVNAYERNPVARRRCLEHYGNACFACGMSFRETYGSFAADYIHVHHVRQLSTIGREYTVDPVADLRPLCPNCHAAIHLSSPIVSPEQLRDLIRMGRS